jgi:3-hydroxyisobutyrate dehydrogenase-like beta-hydroxyacid dehydrogenase
VSRNGGDLRIGFVGIGTMGLPMAINLKQAGLLTSSFDLASDRSHVLGDPELVASGLSAVLARSDVVITMLPTERALEDIVFGIDGLLANGFEGKTLVDMATTPPELSERLDRDVRSAGGRYLEAPVSGGEEGASAGTLTIIAAGDEDTYRDLLPVLEVLGERIFFVGPAGAAQVLKIANNLLFASNVAAIAEAWSLVRSQGVDRTIAFAVLTACSGDSRALRSRVPEPGLVPEAPPSRDFLPGFRTRLALKDLSLARDLAQGAGSTTPMLEAAHGLYSRLVESGLGDLDLSAVFRLIRPDTKDALEE